MDPKPGPPSRESELPPRESGPPPRGSELSATVSKTPAAEASAKPVKDSDEGTKKTSTVQSGDQHSAKNIDKRRSPTRRRWEQFMRFRCGRGPRRPRASWATYIARPYGANTGFQRRPILLDFKTENVGFRLQLRGKPWKE